MIRLLILLFIASICGAIGAKLADSKSKGCFTSIILGFIGALIGSWISKSVGIEDFLYIRGIPVFWSIIGSALFVTILNLIGGKGKSK
ncbi:MAG: GlsB/YeaQ/YmgE family stress response membrane protein [Candidatus Aminicenantes bacterium]|nr:GlsB/YeaQ/YmgE family stress response membrane protein [Candidatus Aminicenantes bacterium]